MMGLKLIHVSKMGQGQQTMTMHRQGERCVKFLVHTLQLTVSKPYERILNIACVLIVDPAPAWFQTAATLNCILYLPATSFWWSKPGRSAKLSCRFSAIACLRDNENPWNSIYLTNVDVLYHAVIPQLWQISRKLKTLYFGFVVRYWLYQIYWIAS